MEAEKSLPYFDWLCQQLEEGNPEVSSLFGHHVHWGYWEDEENPDLSSEGIQRATDALTEQLLEEVDVKEGDHILDVGCGFGGTLAFLNQKCDGIRMTGLNIDPRQLDRARELVLPLTKETSSMEFVQGDACDLPFDGESFDSILAVECIFHFPSRKKFFEEAHRVLKPQGTLVLSDFVLRKTVDLRLALQYLWYGRSVRAIYGDNSFTTLSDYRKMSAQTGFDLARVKDITPHTLPTYQVLKRLPPSDDKLRTAFSQANRFMETTARQNALPYMVLSLTKK